MDTIVLIPAFKPDQALVELSRTLSAAGFQVLVMDDGSGSDFAPVFHAASQYARVSGYSENRGKGEALKEGIKLIRSDYPGCRYLITADGDGQHMPEDIFRLSALLRKKGGLIIGTRTFTGKVPFRSRVGNAITSLAFSAASGVSLSDTRTGLRGFEASMCDWLLGVEGTRYEYETNVLLDAAKQKIPIQEITIGTVYGTGNPTSHFRVWKDSFLIYKEIIRYSLSSLFCFSIDYTLLLVLTPLLTHKVPFAMNVSALISWSFSSLTNFFINRFFVFKFKDPF